ncbi:MULTISPECIES: DUF3486 family protein [unclassified Polaromonas]|jgi:hypothetical protein|uniref:DUF3486 family protein n=1 Tax=unclassified Polaromonas TaxID=2638319 RepID=UPI000BD0717D|nr:MULTISPECIES: DUF3486 family protein [unclassified Polaromonas]OYY34594.1 MAG: terminase [Polaromonas sp. 35-63-35]OYZ15083.1 MAG: terminase [Polaromonas sp. 16-63-31]OYZ78846.1 MAG: terminase [Polaromonas sp. 24-63-21]OZA49640.1 MAG: terminase [Polaromonas sp. 17-63-33]OZA86816.1 MAG: terminase [Polaromonas sp. 39-63-25]
MVKRSKVDTLPQELKNWLDAELVTRGFADYVQLAADLQKRGAALSKSSLHRYGSKFEERMAQLKVSTEQARAVVAASPDDEGAMNEALIRLTQDKLFGVLVDLDVDPESVNITKITKSIADLARSSITQKKWQIEVRTKAAERLKAVEQEAKALTGASRDVAMEMLNKVRAVYEGAM